VTSHHLLWSSPGALGLELSILGDLPLDEGLITGSGEEELNFLIIDGLSSNSEGGDPTTVTLEVALVLQLVLLLILIFH